MATERDCSYASLKSDVKLFLETDSGVFGASVASFMMSVTLENAVLRGRKTAISSG